MYEEKLSKTNIFYFNCIFFQGTLDLVRYTAKLGPMGFFKVR